MARSYSFIRTKGGTYALVQTLHRNICVFGTERTDRREALKKAREYCINMPGKLIIEA